MSARIKAKIPGRRRGVSLEGRSLALLIVGVGLGAFAIGFGITALSFSGGRAPADVVLVPDVREMTVADARRRMADEGLALAIGDSFPNLLPAGVVLAQSPLPGQEVGPGAEIRVVISTGQPQPIVPDVEAMPLALATRALQTAGFDVRVEEAPGEGPPGRVVGSEPAAGSAVPLPATVVIRVGAGMPDVNVPAVIGMLEDDARSALEEAGFSVGEIIYEQSEFGEPGGVAGQDPAPGSIIPRGSPVDLRVHSPRQSTLFLPRGQDDRRESGSRGNRR